MMGLCLRMYLPPMLNGMKSEILHRKQKSLIIDNATGLLDRPQINQEVNLPMEAISAHHTKPWGVDGGFVICNKDEAKIISSLINFGLELPLHTSFFRQLQDE